MGRLKLAAAIGFAALASQASGFFPGVGFDFWRNVIVDVLLPRTLSHADQTSQAITAFLQDHYGSNASLGYPPDLFRFSLPGGVRAARKAIVLANEGVDQDFAFGSERFREKNHGPAHFDNEYLEQGQDRLLKLRSEMIAMLLDDTTYGSGSASSGYAVDKARVWLGRQLHSLQDFYAHSNWVEMGRTTISPVIGRPGAAMYPKMAVSEPTCTDYCINPDSLTDLARTQYFAMHTCYRNCFQGDETEEEVKAGRLCATSCAEPDLFCRVSDQCDGHACSKNTIEMARVTTGYYRTAGDPNSVKPSGKCSHGGLSDSGARGIEGINKDSTMQTYSPHWFLHQTAARLAAAHTKQYLADLLQDWPAVTINGTTYPQPKLTERHMRHLLGLNHGSLAFVIDRSRSMATALPAIKAAIRGVVIRVQRLGYTPFRWVLVGYGQGLNTAVTATGDINVFLQALDSLAVDTTNSCLQERASHALVLAARNSLERSQTFFFTDQTAANLPDPGSADNALASSYLMEARELERTRLIDVHVIEVPNEPGYPYFEHPWPECRLTPTGTRTRDMTWVKSSSTARAFKLQSRSNMILAMQSMVIDVILDRYDTPAQDYKDNVYFTGFGEAATHAATKEIAADGSIDFINLFVSNQDLDVITVRRPDGTTVNPLEDSDVVPADYRASGINYVQLLIPDPQPGTWKVTRNTPTTVLKVDIASTISFSFSLVEWDVDAPHGGWKEGGFYPDIPFWKPPMWTFRAQVDGPVLSVDAFHLRTRDSGAVIMALNLTRVDVFEDGNGFEGDHDYVLDRERVYMGAVNSSTFPLCGDFYATVSGTDMDGIPFVRRDTTYFYSPYRPNWGLPRSPGCPPPAVPPVLVDISTFSSTSTTTTSFSPTVVPPLSNTTTSSSSSASTEISSWSSSWSPSSISSFASSTASSVISTSSVPSEISSSSVPSMTSASTSFDSSSSVSVSSFSESVSSLSSEVQSSLASSASSHSSAASSISERSSISTSISRSSLASATAASSEAQSGSSVWSSLDIISTTLQSSDGASRSSTITGIQSSPAAISSDVSSASSSESHSEVVSTASSPTSASAPESASSRTIPSSIASSTMSSASTPGSQPASSSTDDSAATQSPSSSAGISSSSSLPPSGSISSSTSDLSMITYTSGSVTTSATALPVSGSESTSLAPTSTASSALPTTTTKNGSCRARKRRLKMKRDGGQARPTVHTEEL